MNRKGKWLIIGLLSTLLLVGCSDKEENVKESETKVSVSNITLEQTEPTHFVYSVKNDTEKEVFYTFPTSMQMDYTLYKEQQKLYTQSEVVSFTQALTELSIAPNSAKQYDILLEDLEPGNYTLDVWLATNEKSEDTKQTIKFRVE